VHVQLTHRVLAFLVVLHLAGLASGIYRRGEAKVARRAVTIALSLGVLQLVVAGAMIVGHLPPVLRSLHEATGVSIWIATFTLAYLARIASGSAATLPAPLSDDAARASRVAQGAARESGGASRIAPSASSP
jgi:heme A synthase